MFYVIYVHVSKLAKAHQKFVKVLDVIRFEER